MTKKVKSVKRVEFCEMHNSDRCFHNHHLSALSAKEIQELIDAGIDDEERYKRATEALAFAKAREAKPKELEWLE